MSGPMSMQDRWAADEEMDGRYAETDNTTPMWKAEGLEGYAPGSPPAPVVLLDESKPGPPKAKTAK